MKLRINLEIDVSDMTMLELAATVDRIKAACDLGGRKRVVMRLPRGTAMAVDCCPYVK